MGKKSLTLMNLMCLCVKFPCPIWKKSTKNFSAYMKKSGKIYSFDWNKEPTERQFFKLFFGDMDDEIYIVPSWYICQDEKTANMFYNIAKNLKYHDKFNQVYCDVEKDGNTIKVMYGDY